MAEDRRCVLALGANLGNRLANLQDVLRRLAPAVTVERVSALYESAPVGPAGQPPYYNAVCAGLTRSEPVELLRIVKRIEWAMGRRPGPRWGPRPLDIDILFMDGVTLDTRELTIPHPRLRERAFVLYPLADVAPDRILADGLMATTAREAIDATGIVQIAGPEWPTLGSVAPPGMRPDLSQL